MFSTYLVERVQGTVDRVRLVGLQVVQQRRHQLWPLPQARYRGDAAHNGACSAAQGFLRVRQDAQQRRLQETGTRMTVDGCSTVVETSVTGSKG